MTLKTVLLTLLGLRAVQILKQLSVPYKSVPLYTKRVQCE